MKKRLLLLPVIMILSVLLSTTVITQSAKADDVGVVLLTQASISGANVVVRAGATVLPASDDGVFYLFAEKVYSNGLTGSPIATAPMGSEVSFTVPLGYGTAACHLYDKFRVAVLQGGKYVPVTAYRYITNPEALCAGAPARKNVGKKGLILDSNKVGNGNTEVVTLGVKQGAYNINLEDIIGGNGAIQYNYNGKVYAFDSSMVSQYDHVIRTSTSQGMAMTIVLLNPYQKGEEFMIAPTARGGISGRSLYYMMNTSEDKGLEYLEAVVSFIANRYNGKNGCGQVDNYVVANEVNARVVWNYDGTGDLATYCLHYANSLRVCYNAIKSQNSSAVVATSLDQNWTAASNGSTFTGRSVLETLNTLIATEGNFDWALAYHPYNNPMTWTPFWAPSNASAQAKIRHDIDTPYISMQNIEQLTDYMCLPYMRNTKGGVRPILITELGYTSSQGEDKQAAAIIYAYQRAMTNKYISMIIFNRQTDYPVEVRAGLSVGLSAMDGRHKSAFEYYRQMDGAGAATCVAFAAAQMGVTDWNAQMFPR